MQSCIDDNNTYLVYNINVKSVFNVAADVWEHFEQNCDIRANVK